MEDLIDIVARALFENQAEVVLTDEEWQMVLDGADESLAYMRDLAVVAVMAVGENAHSARLATVAACRTLH